MPNPTTNKSSQLRAIKDKSAPTKKERIPPLPSSLDPSYKAEWTGIVKHLMSRDAWVPQKGTLVETYLINLQAMRQAQDRMTADGGPISESGKPHPASAIIARHSGFLTKIGGQLGLGQEALKPSTPSASAKPAKSTWSA
ncbi:P27 family phage terminase small subunit [Shimia sp.]|uniref:P27 family phage terminase small subunit n=1 Tax=Shimia sp. TaxID=1954381 RepID=UPI0032983C27